MFQEITATYDGKNFVPDEVVDLVAGEKITFIIPKKTTPTTEIIDEYLAKLRKAKNLNLKDYIGVGEKMFSTTEDIDNYIKELRKDDKF